MEHPTWEEHLRVGEEVLEGLGVERERTLVVLNKIDLLTGGRPRVFGRRAQPIAVSAVSGDGIQELKNVIRTRLLSAPDVAILKVPLEEAELVQRAVGMPHQLAQRYGDREVQLALRADLNSLAESGLEEFRVDEWDGRDGDGGP